MEGRLGQSGAQATVWISDTSVLCTVMLGIQQSMSMVLTAAVGPIGSMTETHSCDAGAVSSLLVRIFSKIIFIGAGFGTVDLCSQLRIGTTGTEETSWSSDSSILCHVSSGVGSGLSLAVTSGIHISGTVSGMMTYELPSFGPLVVDPWRLNGVWCAQLGAECACQGIAILSSVSNIAHSVINSDGTAADSSTGISCNAEHFRSVSPAGAAACFCFNRPFLQGPSVTLIGSSFGTADFSPFTLVERDKIAAAPTVWISQTSLHCMLPHCTNCSLASQNTSLLISVPASADSRLLVLSVPYTYYVEPSSSCHGFWTSHGVFNLTSVAGVLCRHNFEAGDQLVWILDACADPAGGCDSWTLSTPLDSASEGSAVAILPRTELLLKNLSIGFGNNSLVISSCVDRMCTIPWKHWIFSSETTYPSSIVGTPFVRVEWMSSFAGPGLGWDVMWQSATLGRIFRIFTPTPGVTWATAASACALLTSNGGGYTLASVITEGELGAIRAMLNYTGARAVWIGLANSTGSFEWIDGAPYIGEGSGAWSSGYPSNTNGSCGAVSAPDGLWITAGCNESKPYICSLK